MNLVIAETLRPVLAEVRARGLPEPAAVRVEARWFARRRGRDPAAADYRAGEIYLNPAHPMFRSRRHLKKYARRYFRTGLASSSHPAHVIRHELVHLLHARHAGADWLDRHRQGTGIDKAARAVMARVSRRAAASPVEFVAEVLTGIWGGQSYDAEVLEWYRHWHGPDPAAVA